MSRTTASRGGLVAIAACWSLLAAPAPRADDACGEDLKRFCSDVAPGQGRLQSCLRAHWGDLKSSCRQYLDRLDSAVELFYFQCEPEIFDLCRAVPVGKGDVLACLRSNRSKLSATCGDAVDKAKVPD